VYRAPDLGGSPGSFAKLNASLIPPAGHSAIQGVSNRTPYLYVDGDPGLVVGSSYWYRVAWVDLGSASHLEPPVPVTFGSLARVMTVYYSITHNAVGNDLLIKVGTSAARDPHHPEFFRTGPPESLQDSSVVLLPTPPNTGTSTTGTVQHFWSMGFTAGDGVLSYLPPRQERPWFLNVAEGGFINRSGRVNSFSMFVNDSPGSSSGTTYVTDDPTPQETSEGQETNLWIPENNPLAVGATMQAVGEPGGVRITMDLAPNGPGGMATVSRSTSDEFGSRTPLTDRALPVVGARFEYLDRTAAPGVTYYYWVELQMQGGGVLVSGPVSGAAKGAGASLTFAAPAEPNPASGKTVFGYTVGVDVAGNGTVDVSLTLHDVQGRIVKTLKTGRQSPGEYRVAWDTTDDHGTPVPEGLYYLRLRAGGAVRSSRVAVAR